ncbi:hypothetical protein Lser_V15G26616 [Lactuca serriola]
MLLLNLGCMWLSIVVMIYLHLQRGRLLPSWLKLLVQLVVNLSSNDGSQNDQVGMNSELASVIREFNEPFRQDDDYEDEEEEAKHMNTINTHPVLLVAAADNSEGLPPTNRRCFSHEIKMGGLTEDQRVEMLSQSLHLIPELVTDDVVKDMVGQTSGFMPRDIRALVVDASSSLIPINGSSFEKLGDNKEFMVKALERSKKRNALALGTPKQFDKRR